VVCSLLFHRRAQAVLHSDISYRDEGCCIHCSRCSSSKSSRRDLNSIMAFTEDGLRAKLSSLNETQDSISTVGQWILFHR
jgi:hypothetical protein